ncbi:MAG: hypothetical protein OXI33_01660 [Chloroflexota bacterium]|nr:hypothetical protein [Chloroflexota bacterium]
MRQNRLLDIHMRFPAITAFPSGQQLSQSFSPFPLLPRRRLPSNFASVARDMSNIRISGTLSSDVGFTVQLSTADFEFVGGSNQFTIHAGQSSLAVNGGETGL